VPSAVSERQLDRRDAELTNQQTGAPLRASETRHVRGANLDFVMPMIKCRVNIICTGTLLIGVGTTAAAWQQKSVRAMYVTGIKVIERWL
jgi:hypothetical protein